jgi:transcription initiation factor TFIID TATA-box-binding protein
MPAKKRKIIVTDDDTASENEEERRAKRTPSPCPDTALAIKNTKQEKKSCKPPNLHPSAGLDNLIKGKNKKLKTAKKTKNNVQKEEEIENILGLLDPVEVEDLEEAEFYPSNILPSFVAGGLPEISHCKELEDDLKAQEDGIEEERNTEGLATANVEAEAVIAIPVPLCHNIVSTSQIRFSMSEIDLQRLASLFPFTSYDRKRFAAITIRLANPHCTCLLFGSGKLVITGSTSFHACIVASQTITEMLREVNPRDTFEVASCVIQNIVAHVELKPNQQINLEALYSKYCEHSTYQKTIFPGLVLRPPESPIVLLIFKSGRIVCTGGKSYDDIYFGFMKMFKILKNYILEL